MKQIIRKYASVNFKKNQYKKSSTSRNIKVPYYVLSEISLCLKVRGI